MKDFFELIGTTNTILVILFILGAIGIIIWVEVWDKKTNLILKQIGDSKESDGCLDTLQKCDLYAQKTAEQYKIPTAVCKDSTDRYFVVTASVCVEYRRKLGQIVNEY